LPQTSADGSSGGARERLKRKQKLAVHSSEKRPLVCVHSAAVPKPRKITLKRKNCQHFESRWPARDGSTSEVRKKKKPTSRRDTRLSWISRTPFREADEASCAGLKTPRQAAVTSPQRKG